jgi:prephenate dehydrogenase
MSNITIIGLGTTGNSIGMGLKRAVGDSLRITGFDPDKQKEQLALRKYHSVDAIAPDLAAAVRGAPVVILAVPLSAVAEVIEAIGPSVDPGATITDTASLKSPVMAAAAEHMGGRASFVGGHPYSLTLDLDTAGDDASPSADMFSGAPWCIMPLPGASNDALNNVINLAENLGAKPLFIDPLEHDSFLAALSDLPVMVSAALMKAVGGSPAWNDMTALAHGRFRATTMGVEADPDVLADMLVENRDNALRWLDSMLNALYDLRQTVSGGDVEEIARALTEAHEARDSWASPDAGSADEAKLRADLRQAINDTRPTNALMGTYLTEKLFRRKERGGQG